MMNASLVRLNESRKQLAVFGTKREAVSGPRELLHLVTGLDGVHQDSAPQLAATGGRLETGLAGQATVLFAPQYPHSVVYNLVSNALK
jgi:signal transduction histidine kinase